MTRRFSLPLRAYLVFSRIALPIWRRVLSQRADRGKEDPARLPERLGEAFAPRTGEPVIWIHALSVGESLALLPLIDHGLEARPGAQIVLTTATRTSADALARVGLPDGAVHQMLPVDVPSRIGAFLDHWRPAVAVFSELDLWPATLVETDRRGIPLVLINCRFSDKNFEKRRRGAALYGDVLSLFRRVLLQDPDSLKRFAALGADTSHMEVVGALKGAAKPLPANDATLATLTSDIGDRPVWLAASTERREDAAVAEAHRLVLDQALETLLIAAPRHPATADETEAVYRDAGLSVARRSRGEGPGEAQVYLADTIGEMGLWYRLAPLTFVAHSLPVEGTALRGKNPFEAIALGSVVLHGPSMVDFSETYAELDARDAAVPVDSPQTLAAAVLAGREAAWLTQYREAADAVVADKRGIVTRTWDVIAAYL